MVGGVEVEVDLEEEEGVEVEDFRGINTRAVGCIRTFVGQYFNSIGANPPNFVGF